MAISQRITNNKIDGVVSKSNRTDGVDTKRMITNHHMETKEETTTNRTIISSKRRAMCYSDKE